VNYQIEEECRVSIPFYYQMIAGFSNKDHRLKAKKYCEYIQRLLENEKYYCMSLFQFMRFDPVAKEVKVSGMGASLSKYELEKENKRLSHYFQEYDDHGEMIRIIRVDKLDSANNLFKFQIKRKDFQLSRTSEEVLKLRKELVEIYQGVSFIPPIIYEECNKFEAKDRTEKFLLAVEGLPKVNINESYGEFYYHTL
jgi:hypothetical protein